ncbi:hypothetical protein VSX61_22170 [Brenneria populi subsp. brevivirga]|uniref:hypothetical protein n=1 Tax=Brenneria populi TaxID=1505588 RepID=UPI002E17FF72|nr:hypothetical protein [Brenneria populi subsp. brevivirga]
MNKSGYIENPTIEQLLDVVSNLRIEVNALNVAFSYLAFSFQNEKLKPTIEALRFESTNPNRDEK